MSASRELLDAKGVKNADGPAWPLLAAALEESGDGLTIARVQPGATAIVFCNRAFTDLTGFAAAETLNQDPFFLCGEPHRSELKRALDEAAATGEPQRRVALGERKNGGVFVARVVMRRLSVPGVPRYVALTFVDVSDHAEIDAAVRQLPTAIAVFAPDMTVRFANEAAARMLGLVVEEFVGRSWYAVLPGAQGRREFYERVLAGESLDFRGVPFHRPDGSLIYVDSHLRPQRDATGRITGVLALAEDVTAQHHAMLRLEASEQWLRAITENSHDIIVVLAADGRIKSVAGNFFEVFGVTIAERVGRSALDFVHPEDLARVTHGLESLAATPGERARDEFRLHRPDGTVRWVDVSCLNMLDDPTVAGVVINVRDGTERKTTESRLAVTLWGTQVGFWEMRTADDAMAWWNDWCATIDIDPCAGPNHSPRWDSLTHPDDLDAQDRSYRALLEGHADAYAAEFRMLTRSGTWRWLLSRGRAVERDASGNATRIAGVTIDIDARKRAELALREAEQRLELAVQGAQLPVWDWDMKRDRMRSNQYWYRAVGVDVSPGDAQRREERWLEGVHPQDVARMQAAVAEHVAGRKDVYEAEYRLATPDGGWKWLLERGKVVEWDENGAPGRMSGVAIDIDERKRMETALLTSEAQLEAAVWGADLGLWDWDCASDSCHWLSDWCSKFDFEPFPEQGHYEAWLKRVHPDDRAATAKIFEDHVSGRFEYFEVEYRLLTKSGTWRWIHERGRVMTRDANGRAARVVGVCLDVDARRRMERSLHETQARLELTVWGSQVGFWDWNLVVEDTRWINDWCRSLELDPCDGPNHVERWDARIHPDDLQIAQVRFDAALRGTSDFYESEYRVLTLSGRWHWIHERGRVVERAADGRALRMAGICMDIDTRKRTEVTLRETEAHLNTALWSAGIAYWDWDLVRDTDMMSEHWFAMTGFARAAWDLEQDPWRRRVHPEDLRAVDAALDAHLTGRTPTYESEYRLRIASGDWKWLLDRGRIVERDANGIPTKMSGTSIDIDARKRTERELEASEYRYRTVAALSPGFVQELVPVSGGWLRAKWVSEGFEQIFGLKLSDLSPIDGWRAHCHPDDRAGMDERQRLLLEGHGTEAEFRILDKRQAIRWLHSVNQPFTDPRTGQVTSVIGVCHDITARKNAELALQKSESILRSVTDNVPDWLLLVDLDLRCRFANRKFLGRAPAEFVGQSVLEFVPALERERLSKALGYAISASNSISSEFMIESESEQRHFEMRAAPVIEQGAVAGLTVAITEITQRRVAETTLRTQATILETIREGVAVIGRDGTVRLTNPAFDRMFACGPGEIVGMSVADLVGEAGFAIGELNRLDFLERHRRYPLKRDFLFRRRDGSTFTGEAVMTNLELGDERVWLGVVQDITERKSLEHEIIEIANREQQRIGSDLHDGLGQELTGIALMLRGLTGKITKADATLVPYADEIVALVNHTIEGARSLARGLSPVSLDRGGLLFALRSLAGHAREMYGVDVHLRSRIWPELTLDEPASNHLYRIAQEAVTNAVRHGQASQVTVHLLIEGRNVRLTISDNGVGLPQSGTEVSGDRQPGMGLKIMAYRARMIDGEVTVERLRDGGTRVRCRCRQPAPRAAFTDWPAAGDGHDSRDGRDD